MSFLWIEGFETMGNASTPAAAVQAALETRYRVDQSNAWVNSTLIDDFESTGIAMRPGTNGSTNRQEFMFEIPTAYQVLTNASVGEFVFSARVKIPQTGTTRHTIMQVMNNIAFDLAVLRTVNNGTDLRIEDNAGVVDVPGVFSGPTAWHYIEWKIKPTTSANGGYSEVWVDDVLAWSSGSRSVFPNNTTLKFFALNVATLSGVGDAWVGYDDVVLYVLDGVDHADRVRPGRIRGHVINSDGTPSDWTTSAGSVHYSLVDEGDLDIVDFVESSTAPDQDRYGVADSAPVGDEVIRGVVVEATCFNTTGGTPSLKIGLDDGTESIASTVVSDTVDNTFVRNTFTNTPTGSVWTNAAFDTIEAVIEFEA